MSKITEISPRKTCTHVALIDTFASSLRSSYEFFSSSNLPSFRTFSVFCFAFSVRLNNVRVVVATFVPVEAEISVEMVLTDALCWWLLVMNDELFASLFGL